MGNKHMTIKIFGKDTEGTDFLMWSPTESEKVKVVSSKGWILEAENGNKILLEENKNFLVSKGERYTIHRGHGQLVLGIIHNE